MLLCAFDFYKVFLGTTESVEQEAFVKTKFHVDTDIPRIRHYFRRRIRIIEMRLSSQAQVVSFVSSRLCLDLRHYLNEGATDTAILGSVNFIPLVKEICYSTLMESCEEAE